METQHHPLVSFWLGAYGEFGRELPGGVEFSLPGFKDPLLSPRFITGRRADFFRANKAANYINEICSNDTMPPEGFRLERDFLVGWKYLTEYRVPPGYKLQTQLLREAIERPDYWQLLLQGFPKDLPFLKMLLPFLAKLEASFTVLSLVKNGKIEGSITVGVAGGTSLAMNAVVENSARGNGVSRLLAEAAESHALRRGARTAFFWSEHDFLGRFVDRVERYRVYIRAAN